MRHRYDDRARVPVCGIAKVMKSFEHCYERLWESLASRLALIFGVEGNKKYYEIFTNDEKLREREWVEIWA